VNNFKLDVGSGPKGTGDVNVDLFKCGWNPQTVDQHLGEYMDSKRLSNFVLASALNLPFQSECFSEVYSSHVIEHVAGPFKMLAELARVSSETVVIRCPHRQGSDAPMPNHIAFLDNEWFRLATGKLNLKAKITNRHLDVPFTSKLRKLCPQNILKFAEKNIAYRLLRYTEGRLLRMLHIQRPNDIEVAMKKVLRN
jgi:hypothetical protein